MVGHEHLDVLRLFFAFFEVHLLTRDFVGNLDQVAQEVFLIYHAVDPRRCQYLFFFFVVFCDALGDFDKSLLGLEGKLGVHYASTD